LLFLYYSSLQTVEFYQNLRSESDGSRLFSYQVTSPCIKIDGRHRRDSLKSYQVWWTGQL